MRLPHPISQIVSLRLLSVITSIAVISLFGVVPAHGAQGAEQLTSSGAIHFGAVALGSAETLSLTLANNGSSSVTVSSINLSNAEFSVPDVSLPMVLAAGQSASVSVTFAPTTKGNTGGDIDFMSNASNPTLRVPVAGTGVTSPAVTASPASLSFGSQIIGSVATLPLVLTNARSWKVSLEGVQISGSGFTVSGPGLPLTLSAGQSVTLNVAFAPQSTATAAGNVMVQGPGISVPVTGAGATATGQLAVAPTALNFGDVTVGNTGTQALTLNATGAAVTVSSSASSSGQFSLAGAAFPVTIPAGQSISLNVVFAPQNNGPASGTLTFGSNAANTTSTESVSGTGTTPVYTVGLSWSPSTSSVMGYNVYRGAASSGPFSKVNPSLNSTTAYTDNTVTTGQTYYYVTTAVNSSNVESAQSSPAEAVIP
jgi:Abnormal spindle-like microcephaly-assoc'd, ASPM-SPD-2-Hydin